MSSPTKQFAWKDRDSAAYDFLQLVYHAPPSISREAASLLPAFRSTQILPQLTELVLDENLDNWLRVYALRAYSATPDNRLARQFEPIALKALDNREHKMQYANRRSVEYLERDDLLDDIAVLADQHPSNRSWFFALIELAHPLVSTRFLASRLMYRHSEEFEDMLVQRLLDLIDAHPDLLDLNLVSSLSYLDNEIARQWLEDRFDTILALCLANQRDSTVTHIARQWPCLNDTLKLQISNWDEGGIDSRSQAQNRNEEQANYRQSPAYLFLMNLYERAADSDKDAYQQLVSLVRRRRRNIPMRAVATNLIGKLGEQHDVFSFLANQVRYANDDWGNHREYSPIRAEAGEAILRMPTAATWEVLVDSYFIQPRNELSSFQIDWIAHLTDVLSGEDKPYEGIHYGGEEHRPWFRALSEVSADELDV